MQNAFIRGGSANDWEIFSRGAQIVIEGCRYADGLDAPGESVSSGVYDWLHCARCGLLCTPRCPIESADAMARLMAGLPSQRPVNTEAPSADIVITDGNHKDS